MAEVGLSLILRTAFTTMRARQSTFMLGFRRVAEAHRLALRSALLHEQTRVVQSLGLLFRQRAFLEESSLATVSRAGLASLQELPSSTEVDKDEGVKEEASSSVSLNNNDEAGRPLGSRTLRISTMKRRIYKMKKHKRKKRRRRMKSFLQNTGKW